MITTTVRHESWPLRAPFTISRGSRTSAEVVVVTLEQGAHVGRGECQPSDRYGESVPHTMNQVARVMPAIAAGMSRDGLLEALPAGAARNAIDCAMWDLEAKRQRTPAWRLAGVPEPRDVETAYTISLDSPEAMGARAREHAWRPLLKLKLAGELDVERVAAVREGAPAARIVVDANESWTLETYDRVAPMLRDLGVAVIEQPLPARSDEGLDGRAQPVDLCADESCHDRSTLAPLAGRYRLVNIKLDKTGGLTEALRLKADAQRLGMSIMVGCMLGTSLAMAPALLLTGGAAVVDLDAPLLLSQDRPHGLPYDGSTIRGLDPRLWG